MPTDSSDNEFSWECIEDLDFRRTYRAKIPGGWLVRYEETIVTDAYGMFKEGEVATGGITFVPDPEHIWEL